MARIRGIYKRGSIYWIRYAGPDGRIRFESSGSNRLRDAEFLLLKRKREVREGKSPEIENRRIGNHSFNELAEKYIAWMEGRHRSASTKAYRISDLTSYFNNIPLRRFNTLLVEQYQTELINRGRLKPASINKNISILKAMLKKAVDWQMVEEGILKKVRAVKNLPKNNRRLRYLSREEIHNLISTCRGNTRAIVITALNTGMRKGEILNLKWENVDLKHGFILLDKTKNGDRREIPINSILRTVLQNLPRRLDVPYVFYDPLTGRPYKDIKRSFYTACKKAGITDFHFHDLRHTFASHLVMAAIDLTTVSRLLGHKSLTMTLRYSHLAPSHIAKAVKTLENTISKGQLYKNYTVGG